MLKNTAFPISLVRFVVLTGALVAAACSSSAGNSKPQDGAASDLTGSVSAPIDAQGADDVGVGQGASDTALASGSASTPIDAQGANTVSVGQDAMDAPAPNGSDAGSVDTVKSDQASDAGESCTLGQATPFRCQGTVVQICQPGPISLPPSPSPGGLPGPLPTPSGSWVTMSDCAAVGLICSNGACVPNLPIPPDAGMVGPLPVPDGGSQATCDWVSERCVGDILQYCDGTGWFDLQQCTTGCSTTGSATAKCSEGCRQGDIKCAGDDIVSCFGGNFWLTEHSCNSSYAPGRCENGLCVGGCTSVMNGPLLKGPQPHCVLGGVQSCGSDLTWNAPVPCVNQTCSGGRCTGVCQAGVNGACNGATIEICDTMGNRLVNTCQSSDLCVDGQGCLDCKPGQLSCSSDKKTTRMCTSAGKWQDTGTCASQTCVDGACVGVCMTGSYSQCNGVTVQRCNDQGQWGTENCGSADLCADGKACLVCKPGTSSCWSDKKSTTVCDASGYSWNAGVTCANQTCVDGACAGVCQVGSYGTCDGATIQKCNDQGQWDTVNCGSSDLCAEGKGCLVCKPGTSSCSSDKKSTTVCDASGSQWKQVTSCGSQTCFEGNCVGTCAPVPATCSGYTVSDCSTMGVPEQLDCDWGCIAGTGCATSLNVCTTSPTCIGGPCGCTSDPFMGNSCFGTFGPVETVCKPRTCKQVTDCGTKGKCVNGSCQPL